MNQTFNLQLGGECTTEAPPKNGQPVLDSGLIPVKISDGGVVTAVSEDDDTWFDYDNKQWANAVLVKESGVKTRAANKNDLTTIDSSDILAYYVWIPRYAYKIWTLAFSNTGQEQAIDIVFQKKNDKSTGTQVGEYYTHPAFTFGSNKELSGIWVGKFETTGGSVSPTILPNISSYRSSTIDSQFRNSLKFAGGSMTGDVVSFTGSSTYGLTSTTDSHMMKNSEWGAVAYLSHSKYGKNSEVRVNNNTNYTTGCGASVDNGSGTTECQIAYGSGVSSYPQSTTGNISGVFDMSGGAFEYAMGNYSNNVGRSYFSSAWFTEPSNSKYYDLYSDGCPSTTCNGHALKETYLWYSDNYGFVKASTPWFRRGGVAGGDAGNGLFSALSTYGNSNDNASYRSVLVVE